MATDITFTNTYCMYLDNQAYSYPDQDDWKTGTNFHEYATGWHVLPTILWRHFATQKQIAEMCIEYEAYKVNGYKMTLFNLIPMTHQLAIQRTNVFTAFNNCMYCVGYQDDLYETNFFPWYDESEANSSPILIYKEGLQCRPTDQQRKRYKPPKYNWKIPGVRTIGPNTWGNSTGAGESVFPDGGWPTGVIWDPFNRPDKLLEYRPGKNSITFTWNVADCDEGKWFNIDMIASWFPFGHDGPFNTQRPASLTLSAEMDPDRLSSKWDSRNKNRDYTMAVLADRPILPCSWWWKEMHESIMPNQRHLYEEQPFLGYPGTEAELCKYPPAQCFIKGMPLFDDNDVNIPTTYQTAVKVELFLSGKKRRSAIYAPTWGPINASVYTARQDWQNFFGSYVRYRTGGMRRTWLNMEGTGHNNGGMDPIMPRESPYGHTMNPPITTQGSVMETFTLTDTQPKPRDNLIVTFSKDTDRAVIQQKPQARKRQSPKPASPISDMETFAMTHM